MSLKMECFCGNEVKKKNNNVEDIAHEKSVFCVNDKTLGAMMKLFKHL